MSIFLLPHHIKSAIPFTIYHLLFTINHIVSNFQSYLIIGRGEKKRQETKKIAKGVRIDLDKVSPDKTVILPVKKSISIDQIRDLKKHIYQKPVKDKFKFVTIEQAEKLTAEAQNALLKIFEEPPAHAIIVLEANDKSQILPTIQSRAVIKRVYSDQFQTDEISLLEESEISTLLEKISKIENPSDWLDNQIIFLYNQLKDNIRAHPRHSSALIREIIQNCAETKRMIDQNVNPIFALANLVFSLHLVSS